MDSMDKKHPVSELMRSTIEKIHELVDTNVIVGQPIHTPALAAAEETMAKP